MDITLMQAIQYLAYFVFGATVLYNILPPKELVWAYFPNARWYGFIIDVLARWASGNFRSQIWDLNRYVKELNEKK